MQTDIIFHSTEICSGLYQKWLCKHIFSWNADRNRLETIRDQETGPSHKFVPENTRYS